MIRFLKEFMAYRRLRRAWTYDARRRVWHKGSALIEEGFGWSAGQYRLHRPDRPYEIFSSLTSAMEAEQIDSFVFRSRQGDVRDTAAAMIPDMDDVGEVK